VTTKSLIAKKKKKAKIADIQAPAKKKQGKSALSDPSLEEALNINGDSIAMSLNLDVQEVLKTYSGFFF